MHLKVGFQTKFVGLKDSAPSLGQFGALGQLWPTSTRLFVAILIRSVFTNLQLQESRNWVRRFLKSFYFESERLLRPQVRFVFLSCSNQRLLYFAGSPFVSPWRRCGGSSNLCETWNARGKRLAVDFTKTKACCPSLPLVYKTSSQNVLEAA